MRKLFLILIIGTSLIDANAQDVEEKPAFEIVKYYYVDLLTNPDRLELPKEQVDSIQSAHMANINKMVEEKVLMLAGPFAGGGGIFILRLGSMEDAEKLVQRDPAISAGRLKYKIREWYTTTKSFVAEELYGKPVGSKSIKQ